MSAGSAERLILASGPAARVLGRILKCPVIDRTRDDSGWSWPQLKPAAERQLVLVVQPLAGTSQVIRWHGQAWECPGTQDLSCVIFGLSDGSVRELAQRDVFGRLGADDVSSFEEWSNYVALVPERRSLAELLAQMSALKECMVDTWRGHARTASVVPVLSRAICAHDLDGLRKIVPDAAQRDWDAVCPHSDAKRIREFLQTVTSGITPDWEEGDSILASLSPKA